MNSNSNSDFNFENFNDFDASLVIDDNLLDGLSLANFDPAYELNNSDTTTPNYYNHMGKTGLTPEIKFEEDYYYDEDTSQIPADQQQQQQQQQQHAGSPSANNNSLKIENQGASYNSNVGSYNNISFGNNQNPLSNIVSPGGYSDFDNSPYGSYNNNSYLRSPSIQSPILNGAFSPSSTASTKHLSKEEKLRRRREFHNAVERKRRDLIKDRIRELGQLIPPSLLVNIQFNKDGKEVVKENRPNKLLVLNKTVSYISHLQEILRQQDERLELLTSKIEECGGKV